MQAYIYLLNIIYGQFKNKILALFLLIHFQSENIRGENVAFLFIKCSGPKIQCDLSPHILSEKWKELFLFLQISRFMPPKRFVRPFQLFSSQDSISAGLLTNYYQHYYTILLLSIELHFEKIYRAHLWCILFPVRGRVTVIGIAYFSWWVNVYMW